MIDPTGDGLAHDAWLVSRGIPLVHEYVTMMLVVAGRHAPAVTFWETTVLLS